MDKKFVELDFSEEGKEEFLNSLKALAKCNEMMMYPIKQGIFELQTSLNLMSSVIQKTIEPITKSLNIAFQALFEAIPNLENELNLLEKFEEIGLFEEDEERNLLNISKKLVYLIENIDKTSLTPKDWHKIIFIILDYLFQGNQKNEYIKEYVKIIENQKIQYVKFIIENNNRKNKILIEHLALPLLNLSEFSYYEIKKEYNQLINQEDNTGLLDIFKILYNAPKFICNLWHRDFKEDYALPCDFYIWALDKGFDVHEEIKIKILENTIKKIKKNPTRTGSKTDKDTHNKVKEVCRMIESSLPKNTKIERQNFLSYVENECYKQNIDFNSQAFRNFWKDDMPNNRKFPRGRIPK